MSQEKPRLELLILNYIALLLIAYTFLLHSIANAVSLSLHKKGSSEAEEKMIRFNK